MDRLSVVRTNAPPLCGPQSVGIVLGNACNLNCITCWSYSPLRTERPKIEWMRRRLDRALLTPLFAELAALQTERVIFTGGGDPLAHPEFEEIAGDARDAGLKTTLISNLTLVRDRATFLSLGMTSILANFSSADPESYVAFHPNRKADDFERLLVLLHEIAQTPTELKLVFVVCAVNAHVLSQLITIAASLGAVIQLKLMSTTPETQSIALTDAQRARLIAERADYEAQAAAAGVKHNFDVFYQELSGESVLSFPIQEVGCYAGHYYSRITASGDVYFCCNQQPELAVGSLFTQSFTELWSSTRYAEIREQLHRGAFVSGCDRCGKFDLNVKIHRRLALLG